MTEPRTIAVVGATGAQGGGLVRAILADPEGGFRARALTRDPSSEAAQALATAGAEVVAVDVDDEASVRAALEGAYGAYFVTFFWDHFSPDREKAEIAGFARAAQDAGVQHVIWSTLEDTRTWVPLDDDRMPTLQEQYKVPHFDAKGESNHLFTDAGVPTTFLQTTFYWDNMIYFGMGPQRGEDGALTLTLPIGEAKLSGISADDIGAVAYGIFREGPSLAGATVSIAGEHLTGEEMASALSDALGEPVGFVAIEPDVYRGLGFPGSDDLGNMFQFYRDFNDYFVGVRDLDQVRQYHPGLKDFRTWLDINKDRIPLG
jgi:uncharacterized protein YbjT (DUF2867 family)